MQEKRILYFDLLNICACFGVVAMHFNGLVHAYSKTWAWRQALAVDCAFYWAVPVFFMLTGATLIEYKKKYNTKTFFIKRMQRVLLPFLVWSFIALVWKVATAQINPPVGPRSLIDLVFNTKIIDIYWFFIPLFMIYLCIPVLSSITFMSSSKKVLWYESIAGAVFNIVLPFFFSVVGITWNGLASFPLVSGYLIYVILGYLLKNQELDKRHRLIIYIMGFVGLLVRYFYTLLSSDAQGELDTAMGGYLNAPCFFESIAVFIFAKNVPWGRIFRTESSKRALSRVAGCSFGIYLIHMIVFWYGLRFTGLNGGDIEWRLIGPFAAYFLCLLIVLVGKRLPIIKRLFP